MSNIKLWIKRKKGGRKRAVSQKELEKERNIKGGRKNMKRQQQQ